MNGKIWIPNEATNLKLRIAVQSHCGEKEHRAYTAAIDTSNSEYECTGIRQDIKENVQSYIHCTICRNEEQIPRPLSAALHGERLYEVVHADFIYMGPAEENYLKYVLIIKDVTSS